MSRLDVYGVRRDGKVESYKKLGNSWLGALRVWTNLASKYLSPGQASQVLWDDTVIKDVWRLAKDPRLNDSERRVLMMTFDRVIARDLEACAKACEDFRDDPGYYGSELATVFREMKTKGYQGVCFNQTSVVSGFWTVGDRPYDINVDTGHWWLEDDTAMRPNSCSLTEGRCPGCGCPDRTDEGGSTHYDGVYCMEEGHVGRCGPCERCGTPTFHTTLPPFYEFLCGNCQMGED